MGEFFSKISKNGKNKKVPIFAMVGPQKSGEFKVRIKKIKV